MARTLNLLRVSRFGSGKRIGLLSAIQSLFQNELRTVTRVTDNILIASVNGPRHNTHLYVPLAISFALGAAAGANEFAGAAGGASGAAGAGAGAPKVKGAAAGAAAGAATGAEPKEKPDIEF